MDMIIQFTPAQLVTMAAAIITISSAVTILINLVSKLKEPETKQNDRISQCENRLNKDDLRIKEIEEGNKITQTALLALLKHSINGNDTKSLKEAEKNLEEYLINK